MISKKTLMGILVVGSGVGLSAGRITLADDADEAIEKHVDDRIHNNADLKDDSIKVKVEDGVATITGTVDSKQERVTAENLARVNGVNKVVNQLVVDTTGDSDTIATEGSDSWITTKIKAKLAGDDLLTGSKISVDTDSGGQVALKGTVRSEAGRTRAIELAKKTKGVRTVSDELKVVPVEY